MLIPVAGMVIPSAGEGGMVIPIAAEGGMVIPVAGIVVAGLAPGGQGGASAIDAVGGGGGGATTPATGSAAAPVGSGGGVGNCDALTPAVGIVVAIPAAELANGGGR